MFALVRHYTRNPVEIEDIVQDTFLKAYSRLASFQQQSSLLHLALPHRDQHGPRLHEARGPQPRARRRGPRAGPRPGRLRRRPAGAEVPAPDARLQQEEIARITREVLDELPEIFRTVLVLREFEGLAYQDIADVLGISIGTVESRLFRARARFKDKLLRSHPEFEEGP